ncbi:hypothetical protein WJX81_001538 [Elliptochloris bilobata]|uniref:Uncharacterized protein n=1 Tax=Elliptochloris bilobata TaxID=381761 RepID=A0AAW1RYT7_9CHLO
MHELLSVSCSGPALASLLEATVTRCSDFDGLILGTTTSRTVATLQDDREETAEEHLDAHISAFACCESACSFYSAAGDVSVPQLTDLVRALAPCGPHAQRVLGWFVRRSGTWLVPSIRDRAVCAALPGLLALLTPGQAQPACSLLFAVVANGTEHGGATLSFQQRFYEVQVALSVTNLGALAGAPRAYPPLHPVPGLPTVAAPCNSPWAAEEGDARIQTRHAHWPAERRVQRSQQALAALRSEVARLAVSG